MPDLIRGLDAASVLTPHAKPIAAAGFKHVGRYLKSLTRGEIDALHAAGLGVWLIFESTAQRSLGGTAAGSEDAATAIDQAAGINAPTGTAIFATVDFDPAPTQLAAIKDYFTAFATALTADGRYKLGQYACGGVLDAPPDYVPWLAGAMGWGGSGAYDTTAKWAMKQGPTINANASGKWLDMDWVPLPFAYDPDVLARADFGLWMPAAGAAATMPSPVRSGPDPVPLPQPSLTPPPPPPLPRPTAPSIAIPGARELQAALAAAGFYASTVDGIWGPRSQGALAGYYYEMEKKSAA